MIQIDDAGNGAVLGGEVIGALRVETGEYVYKVLPLKAYSLFELPRVHAAREAVMDLLNQLKPKPDEEILFCTGDIFKEAKACLSQQGLEWREEKITGSLQELVEASFFNSLKAYGLPEKFRAFHHDYQRFHNLVFNWVCQDLGRRAKYCKPLRLNSGLIARAKIYRTVTQRSANCGLCSQPIIPHSVAIVDKNEEQPVYYHVDCFPADVDLSDFQETMLQGELVRSFTNKAPSPLLCNVCGQKIKYKKRVVSFREQIYHLHCISQKFVDGLPTCET